ncbi:MAG: FkbM family methyltransferase [Bacteroidia bacterium]
MQYVAKKKDIEQRLLEEPEMELLERFVNAESNVIDIGANFAYYTHRLAKLAPRGHVYAFEPIPFTHDVAKKIIGHYRFRNVTLYPWGAGDENAEKVFEVPLQSFGAYSAGQAHLSGRNNELSGKEQHYAFASHEKVNCRIVRIDDLGEIKHPIDFVKIDIEGAELFALRGMKQLLLKDQPVVLLEINPFFLEGFGIAPVELTGLFASLNSKIFKYDPAAKKLVHWTGAFVESNYILIPEAKLGNFSDLIST